MWYRNEDFYEKRAGDLQPGDKTEWAVSPNYRGVRTVEEVCRRGGGVVEVYHLETRRPYHDVFSEDYKVLVLKDGAIGVESYY